MNNVVSAWRKTKTLPAELGKKGRMLVWTRLFIAPKGYERDVPYVVAIVDFGEGDRQTLQVVDCDFDKLHIGQEVITTIRRIGTVDAADIINYGVKVKPL
ncbi:MAG: Zn-ribbon domain-containing OB-fold protein [Candidatus Levyibacteriota bacterium]